MTAESMAAAHTLGGLLRDFEGVKVTQDVAVTGLAIDSRKVQAGDLFMAPIARSRSRTSPVCSSRLRPCRCPVTAK